MNFDMSNHSNSGLLRFRCAPSSVLANFANGMDSNERLSSGGGSFSNLLSQSFEDLQSDKSSLNSHLPPHYPRQSSNSASMDNNSYRVVSSMGVAQQPTMGSSLLRQNSSPAGLFSQNGGYAAMRGVGNVSNGDQSPSSSRLKGQMNFSSSLGMLSRISEIETETVERSGANASDYHFGSWDNDSSHFSENFTVLKRELDDDDDGKLFAGTRNGEIINHPPMLSHHLSLPKTSGEMAAVDKLLHFQDSVPCKIRAKRGCATHPRSIAERVRRTRISERIRKLQELVPNMDKQTNTADMLDLAVDYIKDLQKQYKMLSDNRANCRCSGMPRPVPNYTV